MGANPMLYPNSSFHTNFFINEAHNDYLQLLVEVGGLGFATIYKKWSLLCRTQAAKLTEAPTGAGDSPQCWQ